MMFKGIQLKSNDLQESGKKKKTLIIFSCEIGVV